MNRIDQKFGELKKSKKFAFMPFVVAGDPNFKKSLEIIRQLVKHAGFLELGFPYSDPLADGPTIQRANMRALKSGINPDRVFRLISEIRKFSEIPITVLVYANLVYQRGVDKFYKDAKQSGIDGVLVPDLPVEEAEAFVAAANKNGIDPIFLITQTTTSARLKKILKSASGYLYVVSVLGVTGARRELSKETLKQIKFLKKQTNLPIVVGFGISECKQLKILHKAGADGAIVGSSLINIIEKNLNKPNLTKKLLGYIMRLL